MRLGIDCVATRDPRSRDRRAARTDRDRGVALRRGTDPTAQANATSRAWHSLCISQGDYETGEPVSICHHALLCALPLVALAACGGIGAPSSLDLQGRTFLAQEILEAGVQVELVPDTVLSLRFPSEERLGASSGCNSFDAGFELDGDVLEIRNGARTEMGRDAERMEQDDWYFGFLQSSPTLSVIGDTIELEGGDVFIAFLDQEIATPDLDLVGPTWIVDTHYVGQGASSYLTTAPATLLFAGDGTVAVDTACNSGSATWTAQGGALVFDDLILTGIACDGNDARIEGALVDLLGSTDPVDWSIDVARLDLLRGDEGLGLVADSSSQ